jgi:hypothetical protein
MKIKTINKVLDGVFTRWKETLPEHIQAQVKDKTIITGGSIVSMLLKEEVSDYDMYFKDYDTCLAVAKYYAEFFKDKVTVWEMENKTRISIRVEPDIAYNGQEEASDESPVAAKGEDEKHEPIYFSSNAITLTGKIQIVVRFFGPPEEVHKNFDFVHCTCYWTSWDKALVTPEKALQAMLTKELIYVGSKYPICSLIRIRKFIQRQWTINAGQMLKMILQASELNLKDPKILQDQLVGVDSAYFMQLIKALEDNKVEKVSASYIATLIDRIF